MMLRNFILAAAMLIATPALAQQTQQTQQPTSAVENALSDRLLAEIQANVQARAALIETQRKLAAAEARIKEFEVKAADLPAK